MSLSTDVLTRATPTRLFCRGGRWVLELTRLEAVDRDVFTPRLQRLEGPESILAMLRRSEDGQGLASGAAQIMRVRVDEDRAFEVNEGDWVPSAEMPAAGGRAGQGPSSDGGELQLALAELRAEVMVLRASHARLRERVAQLEAGQGGQLLPPRPPRGSRTRRKSEPPPLAPDAAAPALLDANPGFARTQASPGAAAPARAVGHAAADAADSAPLPPSIEDMARALNADQRPPVLSLPSLQSLNDCMGTLMDQAPPLEKTSELVFAQLTKPRGCKLLDDDGRERGIIVLDQQAAVMLGALLLTLPRAEAQRQIDSDEPSEDCLLATSEICNNLTGPMNAVTGNQHVRSTALVSVDVAELPKPRARLDLNVDGGRLILAMF